MVAALTNLQNYPLDVQRQAIVSDIAKKLESLEVKKAAGI
jgi:hypothetical protein